MGSRSSTLVDDGRKGCSLLAIRCKARTVAGRKRVRYVTPDLSYDYEGRDKKGEVSRWDGENNTKAAHGDC